MTTMQEWVNQYLYPTQVDDRPPRSSGKVDKVILYCTPCERVWNWYSTAKGRRWISYPIGNIPTINKKRTECPNCCGGKK